jgi:conjugal transfer pilus assembly protein TraU
MKRIRPVFWKRFGRGLRSGKGAPRLRRARRFWAMVAASLALGSAQVTQAQGSPTCHGHFPNPITDICWDCFFPLSIGGFDLWPSDKPDPGNPSLPVCLCGIRPGLSFGFWEPVRLIDVTTKPFCFPNLGGLMINPGMYVGNGHVSAPSQKGGNTQMSAQYQAHYYVYPLFYLLELLGDFICFEQASFDLAYMTEIDPTWNDDTLAALVYPETVVFDFPLAQVACAADCVAATAALPLDQLFWCAGCNGSMYPMTGNIGNSDTMDQSMRLAAERMVFKMHRTALAWGTMGESGLCGQYIMPIMRKQQYRLQMVNPVAATTGRYACQPPGGSTAVQLTSHTYPVVGEDVGYLLWRKRNCCAF